MATLIEYVTCELCGDDGADRVCDQCGRAYCPDCGDQRKLWVCPVDGPSAVIEPRQGRRVRRKGGAK